MAKTYRYSRFHHASFFLRLFVFLLKIVVALEVTPDSPCAPICIDQPRLNVSDYRSSFTFVEDITCRDTDYEGQNSTFAGRKFKSCISCQQNSTFVADREFRENRGIENDVYWFLCKVTDCMRLARYTDIAIVNIKAPVIWCINNIFGEKQNLDGTQVASSCSSSCDFGLALNERIFETNDTLQYNYCSANGGTFMKNVDQCQNCVNELGKSRMLANCGFQRRSKHLMKSLMALTSSGCHESCMSTDTSAWKHDIASQGRLCFDCSYSIANIATFSHNLHFSPRHGR